MRSEACNFHLGICSPLRFQGLGLNRPQLQENRNPEWECLPKGSVHKVHFILTKVSTHRNI